jgi:hypothetical protein
MKMPLVQPMQTSSVPAGTMTTGTHSSTQACKKDNASGDNTVAVKKGTATSVSKKRSAGASLSMEESLKSAKGGTGAVAHVRVNSDALIESMSTPPKLRICSSDKGSHCHQSSTVTPSSFAPGSPEAPFSTSSHSNTNNSSEFHFDKRSSSTSTASNSSSPTRPASAASNASKSTSQSTSLPFPIHNQPSSNAVNAPKAGQIPEKRHQYGGFVSRRGRPPSGPMSRNMFSSGSSHINNGNAQTMSMSSNPPAPFSARSSMPPPPPARATVSSLGESFVASTCIPQIPQHVSSSALSACAVDDKMKLAGDGTITNADKTKTTPLPSAQPVTSMSSNIFDSYNPVCEPDDDFYSSDGRPRSPPTQMVCFADGKEISLSEKKEDHDTCTNNGNASDEENDQKKYIGGLFSAPNTPGNGEFKLDLKSPCAFSPFLNVDPNSPTFQASKLTPIAAERASCSGSGSASTVGATFSLMRSPTATQRTLSLTPKGGAMSMSSTGMDLRTPTTLGLLNGSFDTPNMAKSLDTPTFSWLQSPPAGLLSGDVCGTTPVSHFFKEVGGLDLPEHDHDAHTHQSGDVTVCDSSTASTSHEGHGGDLRGNGNNGNGTEGAFQRRPLLQKKHKHVSAMQNHFSQICISPLASSKKGHHHAGHALAYMRSPKSPKHHGAFNNVKFSASPLNVNMEKDLADDADLSILLNLASSSTQG